jgi:threonine synthase
LTQKILWEHLHDFVLVSDEEIMQGMVWMIEHAHTLAEGAGASSLAAAYRLREELAGKKVGLICSGGNTSLAISSRRSASITQACPHIDPRLQTLSLGNLSSFRCIQLVDRTIESMHPDQLIRTRNL